METKFNSQICTTRDQSERLLALGLKKETADMWRGYLVGGETIVPTEEVDIYNFYAEPIPAWGLHRLVEIGFYKGIGIVVANNAYDSIISLIEKRIENGVFNKEYLNHENQFPH